MSHDFDQRIDRMGTDSAKWRYYGPDVLPMWVADMDFLSPEPVRRALRERADHGMFGYAMEPAELRSLLVERMQRLYDWQVAPEAFVFLPGVISGFNLACRVLASPGDSVLMHTTIYPPMLAAPQNAGLGRIDVEMILQPDGCYSIDWDAFEAAITERTSLLMLCNPHNPVGRVFRLDELERMAEICLRHGVAICSDEIHADLLFAGSKHIPIGSLDGDPASRTITLMSPSKSFNIPGLYCSAAIIPNLELRQAFEVARAGLTGHVNIMGYVAALAAYRDGQPWLDEVLRYMEANRDFLIQYVGEHLPGITVGVPEGTYLAWLDCRQAGISGSPFTFFMEQAKVALSDGPQFGPGGEGFVRLNFGCPRSMLVEALERMRRALERIE